MRPLRPSGLRERWVGALVLGLALSAAVVIPAAADPRSDLERNEARQEQVQARIEVAAAKAADLLSKVQAADANRGRIEGQVAQLDGRLAALRGRIGVVREDLKRTQARLGLLNAELRDILSELQERQDAFAAHAVEAYKAGPSAYLEGLLAAETFADLVDRYQYLESTLDADTVLIDQIQALRTETERKTAQVEETEHQIVLKQRRVEADEEALAAVRGARAAALARVEQALATKQSLLSRVRASKRHQEQVLAQLERESEEIRNLLAGGSTGPAGTGQLAWPANGPVTSGYGWRTHPIFGDRRFHSGIDIGAGYGAPVWAGEAGEVVFAGVMSGYGNVIVVDHGGGLATTYNHLSGFSVGSGQSVSRSQQVGSVGCTGYCTGPHLHFEVRINGDPVDPIPYLQ